MTRFIFTAIAFVSISFSFISCNKVVGTGPAVTTTRNISNFSGISLSMDATVNITQDSIYFVELIAQQNVLDILETKINGSTLCLGYKNLKYVKATEPVVINIHTPSITSLEVSGSGSMYNTQTISTSNLDLEISGSGKISLAKIEAQKITSQISGSGKISANAGFSNSLKSEISGSGDIDFISVEANDVETETSGSGTTKVHAKSNLDAEISGSGNVYYKGNPTIQSNISGSGKLIKLN
jgi:hypothetical protein